MAYPGDPLSEQHLPEAEGGSIVVTHTSRYAVRRWIALELRRLREAAGYEPAQAAERIDKTPGAYRHFENNVRLPSGSDVEVLLNWYGRPERVPFFRQLLRSAQRTKDWWTDLPVTVPDWFELYLGLETGAARISIYEQFIPGLFQTREYATVVHHAGERQRSDHEIAAKVDLRMTRQDILTRSEEAPRVRAILEESALRRTVGGPQVMRAQLHHLVELTKLPNIELQVLPDATGAHPGLEGAFTILDYPPEFEGDPGTVYVETRRQGLYYDEADQVSDYRRVFERLQAQALHPDESAAALTQAAKDT